jgi:hypothetical protein
MRLTSPFRQGPGLAGLLAALLLAVPGSLAAQTAPTDATPEGLWFGIGAGGGAIRLTCDLCATDRDLGPTAQAAVGAWAGPNLRVGVEGGGWTHVDDDVRETTWRGGIMAYLRPWPSRGLELVGGAGWVGYRAEDFGYDAAQLTLGLGWEFPLADGWVAANRFLLDAASFGTLRNEEAAAVRDVSLSLLRLVVALERR